MELRGIQDLCALQRYATPIALSAISAGFAGTLNRTSTWSTKWKMTR